MMRFKNYPAQVIELVPGRLAFISLTMGWVSMKFPLVHEGGTTIPGQRTPFGQRN
jgi:hypothetical protein